MKARVMFLFVLMLFFSCSKKEDDEEAYADEPTIEFVALNPRAVDNFDNAVALTIKYKDRNGDLGFDNPDTYALWVKDSRLDSADWYHVPHLAPSGKDLPIEGTFNVVLKRLFILGNGDQEIVSLAVKLRDRSNHWSNIIYTPNITIKKP